MKMASRLFVFSSVLVLLIAGISNAEMTNFKIGKPGGVEPESLFFRSLQTDWPNRDALKRNRKHFSPLPSLKILQQPARTSLAPLPHEKRSFLSFYLAGGMNNIDGGDFNRYVRDSHARYDALNGLDHIWNNTMNWKEMDWLPHLKGEIILNLFKNVGIGLGIEYTTKTNPKNTTFSQYTSAGEGTTMEQLTTFTWTSQGEYRLTVVPVTFNIYFFIPLSPAAEFFLIGGAGYYMGNIKLNEPERFNSLWVLDLFTPSGDFIESWRVQQFDDSTDEYEAKSNAIGYHGGLGLDWKLSGTISLVFEGNYRIVNFKNWEGDRSFTRNWTEKSDFLLSGTGEELSGTDSSAYEGKLWFYEYLEDDVDKWYGSIQFFEEEPEETTRRRNIREAEINLNGFVLRVGIKIRF